jgi:hypothetical protein
MTEQHPITPPPELVEKWANDSVPRRADAIGRDWEIAFATRAAQWGADQELEACCEWLSNESKTALWQTAALRAARRPKPPNLKEQALAALGEMSIEPCVINGVDANASVRAKYDIIRRAIEALPDD